MVVSSYSVEDVKLVPVTQTLNIASGIMSACIEATVKGPAEKLALIVTDPLGGVNYEIISKESMIANSSHVLMATGRIDRSPRAKKYVVTLKTVDPERIVWKEELMLAPDSTDGFTDNVRSRGAVKNTNTRRRVAPNAYAEISQSQ